MSQEISPQGFFQTSAVLLVSRLGGAVIAIVTQLILARTVPMETLGVFFLATSTASVLALLTSLGFPNISNRVLSRCRVSNRPDCAATYVKSGCLVVMMAGLAVAASGLTCISLMANASDTVALSAGFLIVPVIALSFFLSSTLNAAREFIWASVPELLLRPLGFFSAILVVVACGNVPSALQLIVVFFGFCLLTLVLQTYRAWAVFPQFLSVPTASQRVLRQWIKLATPLVTLSLFVNLFADIAIVFSGAFLEQSSLAPLAIAIKLSLLVGFFVQILHQQILPDLSDALRRREDRDFRLRLLHTNSVAVLFTICATIAVALFGKHILAMFGEEYESVSDALTLLVSCQFIRALSGPAAQILVVINQQRIVLVTTLISLLLFGAGSALLIPVYGIHGAVGAICITIIMWTTSNAVALRHLTGLSSHLSVGNYATKLGSFLLAR